AIHDDIRRDLKALRQALGAGRTAEAAEVGERVLRAMSDMISKEEKILFPMSLEALDTNDWARVRTGEEEVGYAWVKPARERPRAVSEAGPTPESIREERTEMRIPLETGALTAEEINLVLTTLPVDISVVDESDTVVYYSATPDRIFPRSPGVIGRKVQNCHPSKSLDAVNKILQAFKAGTRDVAEFWIETGGKFVHIRYFALRDGQKRYRGCLEVSQDVTDIRRLQGEKRLLDWK
ncbi:MAG: PAS domain-containing protein, partial [Candidatus Aminicenantes bacterium]|nr:PAS domain-containing protein [Candidatus Aminicenantes bacterium]